MKVKDLIARLREFDPNTEVYYAGDYTQKVDWLDICWTLDSSENTLHMSEYKHFKEHADEAGFDVKILLLS